MIYSDCIEQCIINATIIYDVFEKYSLHILWFQGVHSLKLHTEMMMFIRVKSQTHVFVFGTKYVNLQHVCISIFKAAKYKWELISRFLALYFKNWTKIHKFLIHFVVQIVRFHPVSYQRVSRAHGFLCTSKNAFLLLIKTF